MITNNIIILSQREVIALIKKIKEKILGIPPIPPWAKGGILHTSDTPRQIYGWLKSIIQLAEPAYIIHTGDLADDIKLENARQRLIRAYEEAIKAFSRILREYIDKFYIVVGNHDDEEILKKYLPYATIITMPSCLEIGGYKIFLSHEPTTPSIDCDFIMFGHQPCLPDKGDFYLNGLLNINVISGSGEILKIPYPKGTNKYRKLRWGDGYDLIHRGP